LIDKYTAQINLLKNKSLIQNKKSAIVLTITTKKFKENIRYLPYRNLTDFLCLPIAINNDKILEKIIKKIDGKIDTIFVDIENKLNNCQNVYEKVIKFSKKSKIFPIKGNDFTVDATFSLLILKIGSLNKKKICIFGSGNIGSKLAIKIVESGTDVYIINSTIKSSIKSAEAINTIKPKECKNKAIPSSKKQIPDNLDVIVGFTRGIPIITKNLILKMKKDGLIIDGGIGTVKENAISYCEENKIELVRIDIRNSFRTQSELTLLSENFINSIQGKKSMGKFKIVSGGIIGKIGDIVVDNISNPNEIIGIADGKGGLLNGKNNFEKNLSLVSKKFKINLEKYIIN
jgi:hypothetical protein